MINIFKIENGYETPVHSDYYQNDQLDRKTYELDRSRTTDIPHIPHQITKIKEPAIDTKPELL